MVAKPDFPTHYFSMPSMAEGHFKLTNKTHTPNPYNVKRQSQYAIRMQGNGVIDKDF